MLVAIVLPELSGVPLQGTINFHLSRWKPTLSPTIAQKVGSPQAVEKGKHRTLNGVPAVGPRKDAAAHVVRPLVRYITITNLMDQKGGKLT